MDSDERIEKINGFFDKNDVSLEERFVDCKRLAEEYWSQIKGEDISDDVDDDSFDDLDAESDDDSSEDDLETVEDDVEPESDVENLDDLELEVEDSDDEILKVDSSKDVGETESDDDMEDFMKSDKIPLKKTKVKR